MINKIHLELKIGQEEVVIPGNTKMEIKKELDYLILKEMEDMKVNLKKEVYLVLERFILMIIENMKENG